MVIEFVSVGNSQFLTKDITITEQDLDAGRHKIEINEPLDRITVIDKNGRQIAESLEIAFEVSAPDGQTEMFFEVETDGE